MMFLVRRWRNAHGWSSQVVKKKFVVSNSHNHCILVCSPKKRKINTGLMPLSVSRMANWFIRKVKASFHSCWNSAIVQEALSGSAGQLSSFTSVIHRSVARNIDLSWGNNPFCKRSKMRNQISLTWVSVGSCLTLKRKWTTWQIAKRVSEHKTEALSIFHSLYH